MANKPNIPASLAKLAASVAPAFAVKLNNDFSRGDGQPHSGTAGQVLTLANPTKAVWADPQGGGGSGGGGTDSVARAAAAAAQAAADAAQKTADSKISSVWVNADTMSGSGVSAQQSLQVKVSPDADNLLEIEPKTNDVSPGLKASLATDGSLAGNGTADKKLGVALSAQSGNGLSLKSDGLYGAAGGTPAPALTFNPPMTKSGSAVSLLYSPVFSINASGLALNFNQNTSGLTFSAEGGLYVATDGSTIDINASGRLYSKVAAGISSVKTDGATITGDGVSKALSATFQPDTQARSAAAAAQATANAAMKADGSNQTAGFITKTDIPATPDLSPYAKKSDLGALAYLGLAAPANIDASGGKAGQVLGVVASGSATAAAWVDAPSGGGSAPDMSKYMLADGSNAKLPPYTPAAAVSDYSPASAASGLIIDNTNHTLAVDFSIVAKKADIPAAPDLSGYLTKTAAAAAYQPVGNYALKSDIPAIPAVPTKTSQLTNDSGYQTASQVSGAVSTGTAGFIKSVKTDGATITGDGVSKALSATFQPDTQARSAAAAAQAAIPKKTSQLTNDSGFLTSHQSLAGLASIDLSNVSGWKNAISTDSGNQLTLGTDGRLMVKGGSVSLGSDGKLFAKAAAPKPAGKIITLNQYAYNGAYWTIGCNGVTVGNITGGTINEYEGDFINDGHSYTLGGKQLNIETGNSISTDGIWILANGIDLNGQQIIVTFYPDTNTICASQNARLGQIFQNAATPSGTIDLTQL